MTAVILATKVGAEIEGEATGRLPLLGETQRLAEQRNRDFPDPSVALRYRDELARIDFTEPGMVPPRQSLEGGNLTRPEIDDRLIGERELF